MFSKRLVIFFVIAACLMVPANAALAGGGGGYMKFMSASSSCKVGSFTFKGLAPLSPALGGGGASNSVVQAYDAQGHSLGVASFLVNGVGPYSGSINYSQTVNSGSKVTFELRWTGVTAPALGGPQLGGGLRDSITVTAWCFIVVGNVVPVSPAWVMGKFITDARLYSEPGQPIEPAMFVTAGKTYLVTGQDASGEYVQILLADSLVWVPIGTVVPDPEPLWGGRALPTDVVN